MAALSTTFKKAIEQYSGHKVKTIKLYPDPQVEGTYAIRTKVEGEEGHLDWLICHYRSDWSIDKIEHELEECEYESWPPVSGSLKFF